MVERKYNVLILCTENSSRSIMAEALFNTLPSKQFNAFSAGSHPTGKVNPFAIEMAQSIGYDSSKLRSKSWEEFSLPDAPKMDFVITVCDKVAGEICPQWHGQPLTAHWGFEDPTVVEGSDNTKRKRFLNIFQQIRNRVQAFSSLPIESLDRQTLQHQMDSIGQKSLLEF